MEPIRRASRTGRLRISSESIVRPIAGAAPPVIRLDRTGVAYGAAHYRDSRGIGFWALYRHPGPHGACRGEPLRTYGMTADLEIGSDWVGRPRGAASGEFRLDLSFGKMSVSLRSIAGGFRASRSCSGWCSMMALATLAMLWMSIEAADHSSSHSDSDGQERKDDDAAIPRATGQRRAVVQLAPTNGKEIAAWLLLCMLVGVAEELVFRGYLQQQFTAWTRGAAAGGVVFSALMFGAAHGYEGARAMFMLSVFGAFFSLLALFRRNLRAGIFAHSWHDAVAGLTVAFLHSRHVL